MESYGYRERKNGKFFKYILVILVTVTITLYINNAMQKASEIDDFAKRLSSSGENTVKEEITEFAKVIQINTIYFLKNGGEDADN